MLLDGMVFIILSRVPLFILESFSYVSSSLFNLTKWALNCPPPKPKSIFYFSAPAPTPEPLTIFTFLSAFSIDIFAYLPNSFVIHRHFSVFFTCLAAYFLQWVINYFVRFCASLGYVLSGADNRDSLVNCNDFAFNNFSPLHLLHQKLRLPQLNKKSPVLPIPPSK